jgi:WhiB family redox-sensing transcriptional regulator
MASPHWRADAACREHDTELFFPATEEAAEGAKAICTACPVAQPCLDHALEVRPSDGVWGGLTALERHRLIRRRQKAARKARTREAA